MRFETADKQRSVTMSYVDDVIAGVKEKNANEPEFIQAVTEVLESLRVVVDNDPKYQNASLLERIVEPERIIIFRVPWVDDEGKVQMSYVFGSDSRSVVVGLTDWGVPYDPLAKPDPDITLGAAERQIGGLGIFIVKNTMDDMKYEYRDGSNILRLIKNIE